MVSKYDGWSCLRLTNNIGVTLGRVVGSGGFSARIVGVVVSHCGGGGVGYDIGVLQWAACLVVGQVVGGFAFLFG